MDASGHRFRVVAFATGLAICVTTACGGAESTALDRPALMQQGDDQTAPPVPEASSSSGGGHKDATVPEEASRPPNDMMDAGDEPVDDAESSEAEAGRDAGMCGVCPFGSVCCMTPSGASFGQCYNFLRCATCCL
jgi:hypothetical protein